MILFKKYIFFNMCKNIVWGHSREGRPERIPKATGQVSDHWTNANGQKVCESCQTGA